MRYKLFRPENPIKDSITLDGSKSISNRLLVLQHISNKKFKIDNLSTSDDSKLMNYFFNQFPNLTEFNVHNAGTVARFLTAFLSIQSGMYELHCADAMKKRPIKILVDALRSLGARIEYLEQEGYLPLRIYGGELTGSEVTISASVSSQYISALMMIAPKLPNGLTIHLEGEVASRPYLEITQELMIEAGFDVLFEQQKILVSPDQQDNIPEVIFNESDWSAAAFYYTISSFADMDYLQLKTLFTPENSSQGDAVVSQYFTSIAVESKFDESSVRLTNTGTQNQELEFDFLDAPDMVPALAVAVAAAGIETRFTGVRNLVIKESNRLVAMKNELAKLGVDFFEINADEWKLTGKINVDLFLQTTIETYEDHRIAMAFGCLGFLSDGLTINDPEVVSKSYPQFWKDLASLGLKVIVEQ